MARYVPDKVLMIEAMEREARANACYDGHGWAHRTINGERATVACDVDRYRVRYGYVLGGRFMNRDDFYAAVGWTLYDE